MTRNIKIIPDYPSLHSAGVSASSAPQTYDILILPGGGPGAKTFCASEDVLELIHAFRAAGRYVAAICAGTTALVASQKKHGGEKVRVTSHPCVRGEIESEDWGYSEERVVVESKVVTSRGWVCAIVQV